MATVYLIHLDKPIAHAKHYLGYTSAENVEDRIARHRRGNGARLLNVANKRGITYRVVRTWSCNGWREARKLERKLKRQRNSPRLCPVCNETLKCNEEKED